MRKAIPKIKEFPDDGRIWRVDWFAGVERNSQVPSEPKIQLIISPVVDGATDYSASSSVNHEERRTITIGVGQLPLVTIGSLWQNQHCLVATAGKTKTFENLVISPDTVRLVKSDALVDGQQLIRKKYHQIGAGLAAQCLAIKWQGDPYGIIIPVAEIIRFYYATSSDLAKAVFAGDFRHKLSSIVNQDECGFIEHERRCILKLRKEFADADAWIIGRILNSPEAFDGVALVHDSMIKQAVQSKPRMYPEAAFPFVGATNLRVKMKAMKTPDEKSWRFTVFALEHCSGSFPFSALTCDRDNSNLRPEEGKDQPDDLKEPAYPSKQLSDKDVTDGELQSDEDTSKNIQSTVVTMPEERFGALAGMELDKPEKDVCHYFNAGAIRPLALPTDVLGMGDGSYSDNGVTPTSAEIKHIRQEAMPASFENFEAMVSYLSQLDGYQAKIRTRTGSIAYIPLTKPHKAWQWSYLDSGRQQRRAVVVADVVRGQCMCSLLEFQWREGESFKLAMVSLPSGARIGDELMCLVLRALAKKDGRWENAMPLPAGIVLVAFKHSWPSIQAYAQAVKAKIDSLFQNFS
ncbi:hypothetical protein A9J41_04360 [Laribacter hongkongensis]|uniref:hypothetical protein n=1 Tax=Laribacter hongkongensis TaxID=168471 RepID=UPI00187789EC|nr:hypothetical protein [Laribacter hongkongensis]MBE5529319.1 hypothetical protein [Laribacter hongkongensis]